MCVLSWQVSQHRSKFQSKRIVLNFWRMNQYSSWWLTIPILLLYSYLYINLRLYNDGTHRRRPQKSRTSLRGPCFFCNCKPDEEVMRMCLVSYVNQKIKYVFFSLGKYLCDSWVSLPGGRNIYLIMIYVATELDCGKCDFFLCSLVQFIL